MAIRSRDEALRILGPYLQRLAACIANAWRDFEKYISKAARAEVSPRTRAAFVNDRIQIHARREFDRDRGVAFIRGKGGLVVLAIGNSFLLRFKKLRPNLRASNIPTAQAMLFNAQKQIPEMPAELTNVNAGYILNRIQTQIAATYVTCPNGKRLVWDIDLASISQGEVVTMPQATKPARPRTNIVPKTLAPNAPKRTEQSRKGKGDDDDDRNGQR